MSISNEHITVTDIQVDIVRKDIKNMHLAVYPPAGRVRVAAPLRIDNEAVRLFVVSKLSWIRKHQKRFREQPRESQREYVNRESHYYQGKRYLLNVIEHTGNNKVVLQNKKYLDLYVKLGASRQQKENAMREWYRRQLKKQLPALISKWESIINVKANDWGIKQMHTKWGSCNIEAKRIWLNLELAKKPTICLEYIIVHELVHLFERTHNDRFVAYMDKFMPNWRLHREELNRSPVSHKEWGY